MSTLVIVLRTVSLLAFGALLLVVDPVRRRRILRGVLTALVALTCESASPGDPSDSWQNNNLARRSARNPDADLHMRSD